MRNWPQPLDLLVVASFVAVAPLALYLSPSLLFSMRGKIVGNSIWRKLENANGNSNSNANRLQWRPTAFWPQIQSHLKRKQPPLSFLLSSHSPFPAHLGLPSRLEPHVYPWNLIGCTAHRAKATTAAEGKGRWREGGECRGVGGCVWKCLCWVKVAFGTCCTCKLALIYQHNGATWRLN